LSQEQSEHLAKLDRAQSGRGFTLNEIKKNAKLRQLLRLEPSEPN